MIVKMALCGLRSSVVAFRAKLDKVLYQLNYRLTKVDPDFWLRSVTKDDGTEYLEITIFCVDDVLVVSEHQKLTIEGRKRTFRLKRGKAESPTMYLEANLNIVKNESGSKCWSMPLDDYVKISVQTV